MNVTFSRISAAAVVVAASVVTTLASLPASAAVQTCSWTGVAGDNKFSTAANWSGCGTGAPQAGDNVVFDTAEVMTGGASWGAITNDSNPQLAKVTLLNSTPAIKTVYLSQLTLASGGIVEKTGSGANTASITVGVPNPVDPLGYPTRAPLVVNGDFVLSPAQPDSSGLQVSGVLTVNESSVDPTMSSGAVSLYMDSSSVGSFNVSGVKFYFMSSSPTVSLATPIVLGQGATIGFSSSSMAGLSSQTWDVSSNVTINSTQPVPVYLPTGVTAKFSGTVSDPAKLVKADGSSGSLIVGNTQVVAVEKSTTIAGTDDTRNITVSEKETTTLADGSIVRGVMVYSGGILKGSGKAVGGIAVMDGGIIAPGLSPGCITTSDLLLTGTYQFELGGTDPCTGYDQIKVTDNTATHSTVRLSDGTSILTTSRHKDYVPKQGQVFTIIDVAGTQPVSGTFKGLAEGATFTQNGIVFKISYKGGDGNDVTLTVQNQPTVPNTGFELIRSNPMVSLAAGVLGAISLLVIARRLQAQRR